MRSHSRTTPSAQRRPRGGSVILGIVIVMICGRVPLRGADKPSLVVGPTHDGAGSNVADQGSPPEAGHSQVINSLGMRLVLLPAGDFVMGSAAEDASAYASEHPAHRVTLSRSFYLGACEVTQRQITSVLGRNPSSHSLSGSERDRLKGEQVGDLPVDSVTWFDAVEFCNSLSRKEQLEPFYLVKSAKSVIPLKNEGYRLPTEAEWEYACRSGSAGSYSFGNDRKQLSEYSWFAFNSEVKTHEVGRKKPNGRGLFDMHGNVSEWCWDFYDASYYSRSPVADPAGPNGGIAKVVRGGAFGDSARFNRSAMRLKCVPDMGMSDIGFRVARSSVERKRTRSSQ